MTSYLFFAQMTNEHQGWLTGKLLGVTLSSAEWVLWILVTLSIISIAVMFERTLFFSAQKLKGADALTVKLALGQFEAVKTSLGSSTGMESVVVREAIANLSSGAATVEEVIAATIFRERPRYERFLSFLGTLGSNAPFIGLFGTVLGIIKAFNDLGATGAKGSAVQQTVMAGISEALVATAVGLAVAIPAVVAYNAFTRALKNMTARTNALGHAIIGHLRSLEK